MTFVVIAMVLIALVHVNNVLMSSYMIVFTLKMSLLSAVSLLYQYKHYYYNYLAFNGQSNVTVRTCQLQMGGKQQCSHMHNALYFIVTDSSFNTIIMYIAAPAAIGVLILTVIVILVLFAICFKVKKKTTRARNQISVAYPDTDPHYVMNADVINFEHFNVCVDPNMIYEELPELETDFSQDSENTYTSMDVKYTYISRDVK